MFNILLYSTVTAENIAWHCDPAQLPESLSRTFSPTELPDKAECLPRLRALAAEALSELRAEAERLDEEFDQPERAETADRSLLLPEASGRLFLRYHAESRVTFQRSYTALVKAIKDRDAEIAPEEGSDSPNGAKSESIATVESSPSGSEGSESPNGAKSDASSSEEKASSGHRRSSQPAEKPYDPNEDVAELLVRLIEADQASALAAKTAPIAVAGDGS